MFRHNNAIFRECTTSMESYYSKLDYIYEFRNIHYILLLISIKIWTKYVHILMYCRHYVCNNITNLNTKYIKYILRRDTALWQYKFDHHLSPSFQRWHCPFVPSYLVCAEDNWVLFWHSAFYYTSECNKLHILA